MRKKYAIQMGLATLLAVGILCGGLLLKAFLTPSRQIAIAPTPLPALPDQAMLRRLQEAIRFPTISYQDPAQVDQQAFEAFQAFLAESYPLVHRCCALERVAGLSLLFTWRGSDPALKPILLLAHQDVVPTPEADSWRYPPFSGEDAEGCIWGRGALDDKGNVLSQLEAMEWLLTQGFTPCRTIYLALGHDEEVGGPQGAQAMAALLADRGVRALFSLDEGAAVTEGLFPGLDRPVALISLSEKGYLTLALTARGAGGHSSQPPPESVLGRLSRAVLAVEGAPLPARLRAPVDTMFSWLAPEFSLPLRVAASNLWLTRPLLTVVLARNKATASTLRTTTAVTVVSGGEKENVLPSEARALVNFRLMPGDSIASVEAHVRAVIDDDSIEITRMRAHEASPIAPIDAPGFRLVQESIGAVFPEAIVAPAMTLAGTDSKHYTEVAEAVLRFCPLRFNKENLKMIHGVDERIRKEDYLRAVQFFIHLIRYTAG